MDGIVGRSMKALKRDHTAEIVYLLFVAAMVLTVLLLPVFPSGDGSMHLYYAHILGKLLEHDGVFTRYFAIRRIAGPYLLQYFFEIAVAKAGGINFAEKAFVALIVLNLGLGFLFLSRQLGIRNRSACLLAFPFLLPWPLAAGFMNYCFSAGAALWGLGLWHRLQKKNPGRTAAAFLFVVLLLVFSHPIPLLLLIAIAGCDLFLSLVRERHRLIPFPRALRWQAAALLALGVAFLSPVTIADENHAAGDAGGFAPHLSAIKRIYSSTRFTLLGESAHIGRVYMWTLGAIFAASLLFIAWRAMRRRPAREWGAGERQAIAALLLTGTITLLPGRLSGAYLFSERIWVILALVTLSSLAATEIPGWSRLLLFAFGFSVSAFTLYAAIASLGDLSRKAAVFDAVPLPTAERGLLLSSDSALAQPPGASYPVFFWSGARAFAHSDAILLNSPWLDLAISPLKAQPDSELLVNLAPNLHFDPQELMDRPMTLRARMLADRDFRQTVLAKTDFLYYFDPDGSAQKVQSAIEELTSDDAADWSCRVEPTYALCLKSRHAATAATPKIH